MRLKWIFIAVAAANAAQAQIRLPGVQLPQLPTQKLTQTLGQTTANSLDQLSDLRHALILSLIHI